VASDRVPTGIASVDRLLGGGLETDCVTEIFGEGGSGKTLFCLEVGARVAREGRFVFYVDTEGVSLERLRSIAPDDLDRVLSKFLLSAPKDVDAQRRSVATACALAREPRRQVGLLVVDSLTNFYRVALSGPEEDEAREALALQLADAVSTSRTRALPALVTNQVYHSMKDGTLEPVGGSYLQHAAKTILRFDRLPGARRRVVLVKHRARPEGSAEFVIGPHGLESVDRP
jgi:DNA repair protein RadB